MSGDDPLQTFTVDNHEQAEAWSGDRPARR